MSEVLTGWDDRLAWSGETPLNYPGLNPVAAQRFTNYLNAAAPDEVDPSHVWTMTYASGVGATKDTGNWGEQIGFNFSNPATEKGALTLPFFEGLWPSSGKLLMALWVRQGYTMQFNPLMNTRSGSPVAYLSTNNLGRLRHNVYGAGGAEILNQYEDTPWRATTGWQWVSMLVDFDAKTSQIAAVNASTHQVFVGPKRALSGAPNPASTAPLEVLALPHANYFTGGWIDEVFVAHPSAEFDLAAYAERIRLGTWAAGAAPAAAGKLRVDDVAVTADVAATLSTGAQLMKWSARPVASLMEAIPSVSTDGGETWTDGALPASFDGLVRWQVPLAAGAVFDGLQLYPPVPTLAPLADVSIEQNDTVTVPLDATWAGDAQWSVAAPGISVEVVGQQLVISSGWASGVVKVTVTLRDTWGRSATQSFDVTISPAPWVPPPPASYPRAPIIVRGPDDDDGVIVDALSAVVTEEVNGEHNLEFSIPINHRRAGHVLPERQVELAGKLYRIRRLTTGRKGRAPVLTAFCEDEFYDLAYAGQLPAREYLQVPAGQVMQEALEGTGWSIGSVTVTTRRTYSTDSTNPLELLRLVQQQHGGDLLFDTAKREVSLVVQSGRDVGVSFFYGRGLTESKRVVDTTSLVTRIYAQNEDGATIASVNGGVPYVEDFTWTSELREATYDFASGTSPWTMLSMAQATLAARAKPSHSYEFTVEDLSYRSGQDVDRFDVGDIVTVVDDELGVREAQRILKVEHDVVRPWRSRITLSGKLREKGSSSSDGGGNLTSGSQRQAFDLVPFNTLRNGRFDNQLAHWAASGVRIVPGDGTGDNAVRFSGAGVRWIEQTVQPDNRDVYSLSLRVDAVGGGSVPPLTALVTVQYEDGSTDTIPVELA